MSVKLFFTTCLLVLAASTKSIASIPPLEREISLQLNNEKVTVAFEKIKALAQVNFSYPTTLIEGLAPVSISVQNKTVREALNLLLPSTIAIKQKNNYIILQSKPAPKVPEKKQISGYVYDKNTAQKVPNVTVYDKSTLQSVTTDKYGYYEITVPAETQSISVNKIDYKDTVVAIQNIESKALLNFTIQPRAYLNRLRDSLKLKEKLSYVNEAATHLLHDFSGYINSLNVQDTLVRDMQISFLPFIGTNHRMSGAVYNRVSFNILGGYARGLKGVEFAGWFNIERENVEGLQFAGLFNAVGDTVKGLQFAGLFNISGKHFEGMQAAGLMNISGGTHHGVALAGLMNVTEKQIGISGAGLMNVSESMQGAQFAGLANVSDSITGSSFAGLFNSCKVGKQVVQVAGLFNVNAKGSSATQIAGFYNKTSFLSGVQIGIINVSDSAVGVPIGLLSIVKKGVHQLELSGDEWFPANIGFRTGVPSFHNVFTAGVRSSNKGLLWQVAYSLGTSARISKRWSLDFTATAAHISQDAFYFAASDLYRAYLGVEYRPAKKFAVAFGPHINYYVTDALTSEFESTYQRITPSSNWTSVSSYGFQRTAWLGARVTLRFF
jgi:hypothetical protein